MVMMGHRSAAVICSVTALICCASAARAATLTVSNGEVLRSRGAGYESIKGSAEVIAGDAVFGKPGSAAQIFFADGCTVSLEVGMVFRVGTESPCALQSAGGGETQHAGSLGGWGDATDTLPGGDWSAATETSLAADGQAPNIWPYVLGAAALGGAAALAQSSGGGGGPPASP
jgi:hypothetical protein